MFVSFWCIGTFPEGAKRLKKKKKRRKKILRNMSKTETCKREILTDTYKKRIWEREEVS